MNWLIGVFALCILSSCSDCANYAGGLKASYEKGYNDAKTEMSKSESKSGTKAADKKGSVCYTYETDADRARGKWKSAYVCE